ncbi:unnamed protein product [Ectocarpus sp. 12 AP-2014]
MRHRCSFKLLSSRARPSGGQEGHRQIGRRSGGGDRESVLWN